MDFSLSESCQILWIDLRYSKNESCVEDALTDAYDIQVTASSHAIEQAIESHDPMLICFDFDLPDQVGLDSLRKTKARYPSLPFLMLTDDHSTELAIWALRARAWDYFVKPVASETAEPTNASPEAPPMATNDEWTERPLSRSSR